jgi:hypothetical protein
VEIIYIKKKGDITDHYIAGEVALFWASAAVSRSEKTAILNFCSKDAGNKVDLSKHFKPNMPDSPLVIDFLM